MQWCWPLVPMLRTPVSMNFQWMRVPPATVFNFHVIYFKWFFNQPYVLKILTIFLLLQTVQHFLKIKNTSRIRERKCILTSKIVHYSWICAEGNACQVQLYNTRQIHTACWHWQHESYLLARSNYSTVLHQAIFAKSLTRSIQAHYLFGGNPGKETSPKMRLDDFWSLKVSPLFHFLLNAKIISFANNIYTFKRDVLKLNWCVRMVHARIRNFLGEREVMA